MGRARADYKSMLFADLEEALVDKPRNERWEPTGGGIVRSCRGIL